MKGNVFCTSSLQAKSKLWLYLYMIYSMLGQRCVNVIQMCLLGLHLTLVFMVNNLYCAYSDSI